MKLWLILLNWKGWVINLAVTMTISEPNEKQRQFLLDKHKHIGYGGARGGGKSWSVRTKAKLLCVRYKGIRVLIVRRTYPQLEENHIVPLQNEIPKRIAKYNGTDKKFKFSTKSIIKFMYCDNDSDLENFQGQEYDVIFIDEATQFSEHQLKVIAACCRGTNDFPKRIYYTCNPGGQGHAYIKRIFIDKKYQKGEKPEEYAFIQALVKDNVALMEKDPDYIAQLEALPEKLRKAWLEGSWDIFEGQFFEEFIDDEEHYEDRQWTHVIEPFDIPSDWNIVRSYDFGYAKPFSMAWWAIDYEGVLYRILELYGCTNEPNEGVKWTPEEQFRKAREIETTHPWLRGKKITGVADPSIWDGSRGQSVSETAAKHQIYFEKGDNNRIPGWMQIHYRMAFDENGYPMMYIFKNCKAFIRTMPLMTYSETVPEDLDTTLEDHVADDTRYLCMSRPIKPRKKTVAKPMEDDPLNMIADMRRKTIMRRG